MVRDKEKSILLSNYVIQLCLTDTHWLFYVECVFIVFYLNLRLFGNHIISNNQPLESFKISTPFQMYKLTKMAITTFDT